MTPEQLHFSQAIRPHLARLDKYVALRVADQHVADICSEVVALAWQKRQKLNLDQVIDAETGTQQADHLLGFLLISARFQIKNLERKLQTAARFQHHHAQNLTSESAEDAALANLTVSKAFSSLTKGDQDLLAMLAWDGLSIHQIANILGITVNNTSVKLNRAKGKLQAALAAQGTAVVAHRKNSSAKNGK